MREINVVSRVRISENGKAVLYEKRYHGILTENGCVRLKAYGNRGRLLLSRAPA